MKRIDKLTDAQRAQFDAHADRWIEIGLRTDPATWDEWERGAKRCYEAAGIPWPGVVVKVGSPLVLALAAPAAAFAIEMLTPVNGAVNGAVSSAVNNAVNNAVNKAVNKAVGDAVDGAVYGAVGRTVHGAVYGAVDGAVYGAVDGAVDGAVNNAVDGAVDGAVGGAVDDAVGDAVGRAVRSAVRGAVDGAVNNAVNNAVGGAVGGAVRGAVDDAVGRAVSSAVDRAVNGAVRDAVRGAVRDAVRDAWYRYLGPWWSYWSAWTSFFRDVCGLELPGDLWERSRAIERTMANAGWWWPHRRFVMVCDRPVEIHREQVAPRGWGSHRLHNDNGPAISWRDGWALHFVHGVHVPSEIVEHPEMLTPQSILAYSNAEVRRVAIERYGWDRFVCEAGLALLDEQPDPANHPYTIALYAAPEGLLGFDARVLLCTNASPERDGTRRRFGLTVPVTCKSAVDAAAWTFDVSAAQYRQLEHAS